MKAESQIAPFLFILALLLVLPAAFADEVDADGTVRIPWVEFHRLLELDKDEIVLSWEDFRRILAQTPAAQAPEVQIKGGKVVLTRDQFAALLGSMEPPVVKGPEIPATFLFAKSHYQGTLGDNAVAFSGDFTVEIFDADEQQGVKIPLFPQNIAIKDALLDGKPALLFLENGHHTLRTNSSGLHRITIHFSVRIPADRSRQELSLPIPRCPVTELQLSFPLTEIEVDVAGAQQTETKRTSTGTLVSALLAPTGTLGFQWRQRLPEVEKGPAKIYSEALNHITIEDDALRVHADITLNVLQNSIPAVVLKVPEAFSVLEVRGNGVTDWREIDRDGSVFLEVPFAFPQEGTFMLTVVAEKLLPEASIAAGFGGFEVVDAIRDKGFVGIELRSSSEVTLAESTGLDTLDVSELPQVLVNRSQKPLLLGFRYLHQPFSLALDITKHAQIGVISTVVDAANGVTLFTEDGKMVHRVLYQVRNTSKQFLELTLPERAQIWSVFVAEESVKPRVSENRILIPLNRSRQGASGLVSFDVELIYFEKAVGFEGWGRRSTEFPVPDVIISQMMWSVYLPVGYRYLGFGGTVEPEETARGFRPLLAGNREVITSSALSAPSQQTEEQTMKQRDQKANELAQRFSQNVALDKAQLVRQMDNEAQFSQRVEQLQTGQVRTATGVLPIRINIPTSGQVYRFAKTIVSEEELELHFAFVSETAAKTLQVLMVVLLLTIAWLLRRRIYRFTTAATAKITIRIGVALIVLVALITWPFSKVLSLALFLSGTSWLAFRWVRAKRQPSP